MSPMNTWRGLAAMTVIAVAVSALWLMACGWVGSLASAFFPSAKVYEGVMVVADGTPLISTRRGNDYEQFSHRTLEGDPVTLSTDASLNQATLNGPRKPPGLVEFPIGWRQRITGTSNYSRPGNSWYLIRDTERPGGAYFELFDQGSNARIGYYGREGLRQSIPDRGEWFDVGEYDFAWGSQSAYAGSAIVGPGRYVWSFGNTTDEGAITPWMLYLKDGDAVLEIDLRKRTHRTLATHEGLLSVALLSEPLPKDTSEEEVEQAEPNPSGAPTPFRLQATPASWTGTFGVMSYTAAPDAERKTKRRLAVRDADSITLIDTKTDNAEEFRLPEAMRGRDLSVYSVGNDQLLISLSGGHWSGGSIQELVWISPEGEAQRRERIELAGYTPPSQRTIAWGLAGVLPTSIASAAHWFGYRPLELLQTHEATRYVAAFRRSTEESWPARGAVLALGVAMAAAVFALHRKRYRPHAAAWAIVAGLLGPAGLAGYLMTWRRPPMTACESCARRVPRDRDACPACQAEWPTPAVNGVEVFDSEAA